MAFSIQDIFTIEEMRFFSGPRLPGTGLVNGAITGGGSGGHDGGSSRGHDGGNSGATQPKPEYKYRSESSEGRTAVHNGWNYVEAQQGNGLVPCDGFVVENVRENGKNYATIKYLDACSWDI